MPERRIVMVPVAFEFLLSIMTQDYEVDGMVKNTKGLPKDAEYIGSTFDPATMQAHLFFRHDSFDLVPDGEMVPMFHIEFTRYYQEKKNHA